MIFSDYSFAANKRNTVIISRLFFYQDQTSLFILLIVCLVFYYISLLFFLFIKNCKKKIYERSKKAAIPYRKLESGDKFDPEEKMLVNYISENFCNPELTINLIVKDIGLLKYRIPVILKKCYNLTFPQYLNAIRLKEAKRLLLETEKSVSEIILLLSQQTFLSDGFSSLN